ncbi:MAG TPA: NAD(P)H-dependent glycerol-3-phosphate dehydrogenase [Candidatus Acidoferrales bacterium]|nr:NAD(P)H-dependent glycerol-3-phosphate dehydrogenase [Candidatus Acidoferrales bacterium]
METIAILGGGSWGTALALVLARSERRPRSLRLWVHDPRLARAVRDQRVNETYLPGFPLPPAIEVTSDLAQAVAGAELIVGVMPSAHAREIYTAALPHAAKQAAFLSATKGLETGRLARMSQVVEEAASPRAVRVAALSGPSFAREVARGDPTAVVAASADRELARAAQELFSGPTFRIYTSADILGVELGGAVKNIIAIAAGICVGLGLGHSSLAALVTRGAAEMTRLACALGAEPRTLAGLSGIGDLVLTATGTLSRNRAVGIELGRGRRLAEILRSTRMVAEGVGTTAAAIELARRAGVEMPITEQMYAVLYQGRAPSDAIRELMQRRLKEE